MGSPEGTGLGSGFERKLEAERGSKMGRVGDLKSDIWLVGRLWEGGVCAGVCACGCVHVCASQ